MTLPLDAQAESAAQEFRGMKSRHKRRKAFWKHLTYNLRARAIRATTRRARAVGELPLFRGIAA